MKRILSKVKKALAKLVAFIPTSLPIGMTEFGHWADSIVLTYDLPDNDSTRFALATMILHLDSTSASKPKRYFGLAALKSMSNQIAGGVMQELKDKQQAARAAEVAALVVESTKQ